MEMVFAAAVIFFLGILVGRTVGYRLFRFETVMVLEADSAKGCAGYMGTGEIYLDRHFGQSDGRYKMACGERVRLSAEAQVVCHCP
ncbi:hypothetical protein [Corallococcus carmarthensis]|uniref:Uncharacterized protein n=1 Tax=Corallococcus carmarthensis TaxID=2316728 RepID=A0A3A8KBH6_9BACT|nr:hypothetical protein [Corallococcus carmarthensis]NOK18202.1 hypothetical protein [Corallococcus carmarthensis]RKG99163.1 hypothetical protein D7X32_27235 [Corallococcus carmarthensis]